MNSLKQYQTTSTQTGVVGASPHRLIQMLFEGALDKISIAKGFIVRNDIEKKGLNISWAIKIIGGLQNSLNMEAGGELAKNLDNLYEYMCFKLVEANAENSIEKLDEVSKLLSNIKEGWDGIESEVKAMSTPQRANTA
jgi:flagellar protein FliS